MSFVLVTGPTVEPLSAADVRSRLSIGTETVDATLNALVSAARLNIERRYGVAMITQTLDYVQDGFQGCWNVPGYNPAERGFYPSQAFGSGSRSYQRVGQSDLVLPLSPVQSVASVSYLDSDGILRTLDPSIYILTKGDLQSRLSLAVNSSWPATQYATGSVKARVIAGFGDTADKVPETLKLAVLLRVSYMVSLTAGNLFVSSETEDGIGSTSYVVGGNAGAAIDAAVSSLLQDYVRPSL